jgi:hypothetical protein
MKTKTHNRFSIAITVLLLLLALPGFAGAAISEHTIQIEFIFDYQSVTGKSVTGYRLYKEGEAVCESPSPDTQYFDCVVSSGTGVFDFTLTARYNDGTESPHSAAFPLTIVDETSPLLGLMVLTGSSPDGIEGLGGIAGVAAVDLADVIQLLRQQTIQ